MRKPSKVQNPIDPADRSPMPTVTPKQYALEMDPFNALCLPIGALILAFNQLELKLTMTIDALMGMTPPEGWALEALMINFSIRIQLFHTLALMHTRDKELRAAVPGIISRLNASNTKRNDFVHGTWTAVLENDVNPGTQIYTKIKHRAEAGLKQIGRLYRVSVDDVCGRPTNIFLRRLRMSKNGAQRSVAAIILRGSTAPYAFHFPINERHDLLSVGATCKCQCRPI